MRKVEGKKEIKFFPSEIKLKEKDKTFKSEGFIATTHPDRDSKEEEGIEGDILSEPVIDKITYGLTDPVKAGHPEASQVSYRHDYLKEDNPELPPAGVNLTAEKRQTDDGHWGVYVETEHNKNFPDKDNLVYEIDKKIIPGYSIEYDVIDSEIVTHDGKDYRFIKDIDFYGYGFANGRKIANPQAAIVAAGYKEMIDSFSKNKHEVKKMKEKEVKEDAPEEKKEEPKEEDKKEEKEQGAGAEEKPAEPEKEKPKADIKELKESIRKEIIADLKGQTPDKTPLINKGEKMESKEVEFKELVSYKEAIEQNPPEERVKENKINQAWEISKNRIIDTQWKEAAKLHQALESKGVELKSTNRHSHFQMKEGKLEFKTLTTDSNVVGSQTTYVDALSNYEQTPAELNDIYGPVIINQLNNMTTTWNLLTKEDHSGDSAIRFRARTVANTGETFALYGSTPSFTTNVTRIKLNLHFVTAYVPVAVEDEEIELARATGGVGDIFAKEISDSTLDLMTKINRDLLRTATASAENQPYTFETTIITSGSLYGRTVTDAAYTTLAAAGVTNATGAPITLKKLRDMMDASLKNGAQLSNLIFIANHTQVTKILTLIQALQRTVPTSARVGFEGTPEFDGAPIFRDKDANTDDIWLIDSSTTKIGLKKAASFVEFGKTELKRKGIVWMMYNLFSTNPNHNYWTYGLQTT